MADDAETTGGDSESASSDDAAQDQLVYESNPKHSDPWQIGKRGSICEPEVRPLAANLLLTSVIWKGKRYAVREGERTARRSIRRTDGTDTPSVGSRFRRS
jgi:hypothetical protein